MIRLLVSALALLLSVSALAESLEERIRERLEAINPRIQVEKVVPSPIEGLMEAHLGSGETLFTSPDGSHFVLGDLYRVQGDGFVNLSDARKKGDRVEALEALATEDMIVFSPEGETRARLYVFTDVDCGYCRKLHSEMAAYNDQGIEIRYLAFPRAGIGSSAYKQMVAAWCADDPQQAITRAKQGEKLPSASCANPVADQYRLGQAFGISGTPALVFEDGSLMPGYVPADRLAAVMELN